MHTIRVVKAALKERKALELEIASTHGVLYCSEIVMPTSSEKCILCICAYLFEKVHPIFRLAGEAEGRIVQAQRGRCSCSFRELSSRWRRHFLPPECCSYPSQCQRVASPCPSHGRKSYGRYVFCRLIPELLIVCVCACLNAVYSNELRFVPPHFFLELEASIDICLAHIFNRSIF
jgi:hypothetical protein